MSEPARARVVHAELATGLPDVAAESALGVFLVLWWRGLPLGHLDLDAGARPTPDALAQEVARVVAPAVTAYLGGDV